MNSLKEVGMGKTAPREIMKRKRNADLHPWDFDNWGIKFKVGFVGRQTEGK